jgi:hypothetical protein
MKSSIDISSQLNQSRFPMIFIRYHCQNHSVVEKDESIEKDESFIDTFSYNDQEFYRVLSPHKVLNVDIGRPLYDQIVQQEITELYKLKTPIESKGGKITDLNTDMITCTFEDNKLPTDLSDGKNIEVYNSSWNDNKTILKYKLEPEGKLVLYPKRKKYQN